MTRKALLRAGISTPRLHLGHLKLLHIDERKPIQKQCPTCRTMTNWMLAFPDRRSGGDRRKEAETVSQ